MHFFAPLLLAAATLTQVAAVGRMIDPPHRGYIGRLPQFKDLVPIDWTDNVLNAGGVTVTKGGKWGLCGDKYTDALPRAHEDGGVYGQLRNLGSKVIAGCYAPGATIPIQVQLTANHKGHFTFALCKLNGRQDSATEDCFKNITQPNGQQNWPVPDGNVVFTVPYVLPAGVTCEGDSHCILRWFYIAGNNPSSDPLDQQLIWNCADIYISSNCGGPQPTTGPSTLPPVTTAAPVTTATPVTTRPVTTTTAAPVTPAPTSAAPVTTRPSTTQPPVSPTPTPYVDPTTRPPVPTADNKCNGNTNTCYWPLTQQPLPYSKADCALFSSFVWCP